jgi:hypothetical protein
MWIFFRTEGIKVAIYWPVQLSGLLTQHKVSRHSFRIHNTQQTLTKNLERDRQAVQRDVRE